MQLRHILAITLLMLFCAQLGAGERVLIGTPLSRSLNGDEEQKWYYPYEISDLDIKQSNDGTGIIRGVHCGECDFQIVKITPDTKVIVNGNEVHLLRARERDGQDAYIEFDKETAEVKHIYWSE
ncbi:MAG: hypothetical protein JSW45_03865 [Thiotrichales bacterium]|nr:MAG: hypothetical protein JSW45_03865 [Thiotrichales bacterium]